MNDTSTQTTRLLKAAPHEVYAAIGDPTCLAKWWGPDGFTNTFDHFEFVPGGRWVFTMHGPNGADYANECIFTELVPNERVVIEHIPAPHFVLTMTLTAEGNHTRITWVQTFDTPEVLAAVMQVVGPANEQNLNRLEAELVQRATGLTPVV
jgi:uncharacterized protein YndB with AHSA1/START domain